MLSEPTRENYAELEEKRQPIELRDAIIGAITLTEGYAILTRNVEHLKNYRPNLYPVPPNIDPRARE